MHDLLVYGLPLDYHVSAVAWGLRHFGVGCRLWVPGDLPDHAGVSLKFDEEGTSVSLRQGGERRTIDDVQLIWNRRVARPVAPAHAAAVDRSFIEDECFEHVNGIRHVLGRRVITVNDPAAQLVASRKSVQIEIARRAGFHTMPTLISNDYDEIVAFWERHAPLIVKPFKHAAWKRNERIHAYYTTAMPDPREDYRAEIELCPQIYQKRIAKACEVRLVAFGGYRFAMRITGPPEGASLDVRNDMRSGTVDYARIDAPAAILLAADSFMSALGLHYAAFDFAVDDQGRWVFLECNESGQFLFLESAVPDIAILDAFCRWFCELMDVPGIDRVETIHLADFQASGCWERESGDEGRRRHKLDVVVNRLMVETDDEADDERAGPAPGSGEC